MAKSEYPRVGSHHSDHEWWVHSCDMCAGQIGKGERFRYVDIETRRFKGETYEVKLCDKCWRKHKTAAILEWWLKRKKQGD